ncbi:hypothetical protein [Nostoc sp. JL33]|nr:hypothetical protein [Nostoc sp. JL33]
MDRSRCGSILGDVLAKLPLAVVKDLRMRSPFVEMSELLMDGLD